MRLLEGEIPPLQNEDLFLSSSCLKGTLHHYKMKIGFYMFLSSGYLKGTLPKGNFPCYKMRLGFNMLSSDGQITKGSVSYLSSPCFSTSLGGIGGPAHGIHGILAGYVLDINYKGGAPPPHPQGTIGARWKLQSKTSFSPAQDSLQESVNTPSHHKLKSL